MVRRVVVLAAVAVAAAGCGGGGGGGSKASGPPLTKAAYQAKLAQTAKEVGSKLNVSKPNKLTKQDVANEVKAVSTFADDLERINPPAAVKQAHADLIAAMRQLAREFPGILQKLTHAKGAQAAFAAFLGAPAIQRLIKVQQEFKAKGYTLNLNG